MDATRFSQFLIVSLSLCHIAMVALVSLVIEEMSCPRRRLLIMAHKFSIELMSGELPGQSKTKMLLSEKYFFTLVNNGKVTNSAEK